MIDPALRKDFKILAENVDVLRARIDWCESKIEELESELKEQSPIGKVCKIVGDMRKNENAK